MLLLAVILTVVAATFFAVGIVLLGYVVAVKLGRIRDPSRSGADAADSRPVP